MKITKEQQVLQQVINEAWENVDFKKKLMANPEVAIEELTGAKLNIPEGKTFVVRDQTDESTVYINIPAEQKLENVELNEEQLEAVAGGKAGYGYVFPIDPIFIFPGPPQPIVDPVFPTR
ncbi:NHLP leader peptide family RiPP precursor [Polaribacter sp. Q13]|uniref:NHLP leader peptide family RiPP precursor n=1 Tax=Polaribacter sp. Q13 TaxID=2806551 RepID=UPI00193C831C|nr:NHLP leader peptide family RiPP precursor [Polaribacter sp. Q13]QVY64638.1 NHLP leader peptide family RiPP precursor [Polaribacter sp. Q13]